MLTGLGAYYAMVCLQNKEYKKLSFIIIAPSSGWASLCTIIIRYLTARSIPITCALPKDYFLYFTPHLAHWKHNYYVCVELLYEAVVTLASP